MWSRRLVARTREMVLGVLGAMSPEEYHRAHARETIDVAADWVVFHLIDHEMGSPRPLARAPRTSSLLEGEDVR